MTYLRDRRFTGRMIVGTIFIVFGTLLLLHKLDVVYLEYFGIDSFWQLWPAIFVFIGLFKLADAPSVFHFGDGAWWIFLGIWLYISINHIYGLSFRETWPAIIIAWGVSVIWESFKKNAKIKAKELHYGKQ